MRCGGGFTEVVGMSTRSRLAKDGETRSQKEKKRKSKGKKKERTRKEEKKGVAPLIGAASE